MHPWLRKAAMLGLTGLALAGLGLASCQKTARFEGTSTSPSSSLASSVASSVAGLGQYLPERAGTFVGGPLRVESGFVRRSYTRGPITIVVTLADTGGAAVSYDDWLKMSAGYAPASLDVPPASAAGFYTCAGPGDTGQCDLHIHCRAGYHLELMGSGGASRSELDLVIRSIGLRDLVTRGAAAPS